ncbi:MAG: flagellar protein FlaG [Pseudomonadota bacterium]
MDIKDVNTTVSPLGATQPVSSLGPDKATDEIKRSKSIQTQPEKDNQKKSVTIDQIDDLSKELNNFMEDLRTSQGLRTSLGFVMHEKLDNQVVVEIKDKETGEIIRQIPPEELLKIREKMIEQTGLLFDQKI